MFLPTKLVFQARVWNSGYSTLPAASCNPLLQSLISRTLSL